MRLFSMRRGCQPSFCRCISLPAACVMACALPVAAQIPEQYPKPLMHTASDHPAQHVLLLTVNGLHASDLASWVVRHPRSALADLSAQGVTYTNAHTPIANATAGLLAIATGGTPISTGILAGAGYDHGLSPPGSHCRTQGAGFVLERMIATRSVDMASMPLDPSRGCMPMRPHDLLRVNTIFEIVHDKVGLTGWAADSAAATDLLSGPSGKGLDEAVVLTNDTARVEAVLHWIDGRDAAGLRPKPVPALFGMSLSEVLEAQTGWTPYTDRLGTPSAKLEQAIAAVDSKIGRLFAELKRQKLDGTTWLVVTAAFGGPGDKPQRCIPLSRLADAANTVKPGVVAQTAGGSTAMVWLNDRSQTRAVAEVYSRAAARLGIRAVICEERLSLTLNAPQTDSRMPDILLEAQPGVVWTDTRGIQGSGSTSDEATQVALLVSGAQLVARIDPTLVPTTQIAPLLLRALGLEKFDLDALHREHTPALPGIF